MSEGKLAMFGKTFNTVGSIDSNLILKTKGDLKIQWGGKFIDLIKNGKIASTDSNILKKISSAEEIEKDGIYLVSSENGEEVWISIEGTKINITGDTGTTYVSFLTEQKVTSDQKYRALTNIGFYYDSLEQAQSSEIKAGIVFISKENKLYTVKDGVLSEYVLSNPSDNYFEEITIGELRIYKEENQMNIQTPNLQLWVGDQLYLDLNNCIQTKVSLEMKDGTFLQSEKASKDYGFRLYKDQDKYVLDVDNINLRGDLNMSSGIEVTYLELRELIERSELIFGKEYIIKDFQNSWEASTKIVYEDVYDETTQVGFRNVRPIVLKAKGKNSFEPTGRFFDYPEWIIHYDYTINGEIQIIDSDSGLPTTSKEKGRITYLKDEYNNEANYDFKHLKFLMNGKWYYTFSNEIGEDASLYGGYLNNSIVIKDIMFANKDIILSGSNKLVFVTSTSNNSFKNFEGQSIIKGDFNNNIVHSKWTNNIIAAQIKNCEFLDNVTGTSFNKAIVDCIFKGAITSTDMFTKVELHNCQINSIIKNVIELPDETLISSLKSLEPKQVSIITKESKQYLQITSNALLTIPSGVILMWAGTKAIPYGWVICDGENGTPNLLGKFIKVASTIEEVGEVASDLNDQNELIIKQENLPKHSHAHVAHTHTAFIGELEGTVSESGNLQVDFEETDYNWGIRLESEQVLTSVAGEGITMESTNVNSVSEIKTQGGIATGGNHTHNLALSSSNPVTISDAVSEEEALLDTQWPNKAIKIEPRSYALLFIMKL